MFLFALAGGRSRAGTATGDVVATYWATTCWDTAMAMTTTSADQTAATRDDHTTGLVTSLHQSDVDVV
jgi:hypothetical protein